MPYDPNCSHTWIANSGQGGEPEFRLNRQMGSKPTMHVVCCKCNCRTWFTEDKWTALPMSTADEATRT